MPPTAEEIELIATSKEVTIETRSGDRVYPTVLWAVVDDDKIYVRSFLGDSGRWYQRAVADPEVTVEAGDTRIDLRAVPAIDEASIEVVSAGFRAKYGKGASVDAMVQPDVLDTTLRLDPRS
jgi:hypothetical protein